MSSALGSHIMQVRHKAFFHALKQNGLKSDPTCAGSSYYITQCMEKHLPRLLDMGITGIICSYDLIANAAMIQCQQLGYKVPDEISIIGFDAVSYTHLHRIYPHIKRHISHDLNIIRIGLFFQFHPLTEKYIL